VVRRAFRQALGRDADEVGLLHYTRALRNGMTEVQLIEILEASEEAQLARARAARSLPDIVARAPHRYEDLVADDGTRVPTYKAEASADFDWIEDRIITSGYYETPGIWSFGVDLDKQLMAEMISLFNPASALEFGCSSGSVLAGLVERGIDAFGVDISELAKSHAIPSVRERILIGDIRLLSLPHSEFDIAFGLDIFEHLHPDKLDSYIGALVGHIRPGGILLANVPAFGRDAVFGEVFPMFLASWRDDAASGQIFRRLQVDEQGFPMHGHLVWATTGWWEAKFEAAGLLRVAELEAEIQRIYGDHFRRASPARQSTYVFGRDITPQEVDSRMAYLTTIESSVLADMRNQLGA
jgi:2-polyprenyl-3-methyl-5-hydroxy-6-metoxy-1,4-benzoquinol methylase